MKKFIHTFIPAILAGVCIALGGTVFLSSETKLTGALFFCLGLLTILTCGFGLFTGKVCYTLDNKPSFLGTLGIIWLGNMTGTGLSALFARFTRNYQSLNEKAAATISAKLSDSLVSLFVLGIGCGICIYIAINSYKTQDGFLKVTLVILPVMVFIFCGFEHCVANMFYIPAGMMTASAYGIAAEGLNIGTFILNNLIPATIGNIFGGVIVVGFLYWYLFLREKN